MDNFDPTLKREFELLTLIVNLGFQEGWITEIEQLRIKLNATVDLRKLALFKVLVNTTKCDENASRLFCALRCIDEMKLDPPAYSNTHDEQYYQFKIMSYLNAKGLVTNEQKLIYENHMKEKSQMENVKLGISNTEKGGIIESETNELPIGEMEANSVGNSTNPMLIPLVINCLLQYLDFEEVKSARYISKVWSSVALSVLKSRSIIEFSQSTDSDPSERRPLNFLSIFPIETLENDPFTSFSFLGSEDAKPWAIEELNFFFRNSQNYIKDLALKEVYLVNENWEQPKKYDISPWLQKSAMTKPNYKYNTRFAISVSYDYDDGNGTSTMIFVQLSALINIKELVLRNCEVYIQEGIVLSPTRLIICNVCFYKNGNKLTQICVNDIADLSKSKEIGFSYAEDCPTKPTKMILDMERNADIKLSAVTMSSIVLNNFENCKWNVDTIDLNDVIFTERTMMQVKELTLHDSQVDISVLPQSLEKLSIARINQNNCVCTSPIVLQNLKAMKLNFSTDSNIVEFLRSQTFQCPALVELHLKHNSDTLMEIELSWIPQTLKILKLKGIRIEDEGIDNTLTLDKLVLNEYSIYTVEEVCGTHIQTSNLVLSFPFNLHIYHYYSHEFVYFLNHQNICCGSDQRIYAGPFSCAEDTEEGWYAAVNPLTEYVDRESEYYVFENKVGRAIQFEEFETERRCNYV